MLSAIQRRHEMYTSQYCTGSSAGIDTGGTAPGTLSLPPSGHKRSRGSLSDDEQAAAVCARSPRGVAPSQDGSRRRKSEMTEEALQQEAEAFEVTGGAADLDPEAQAELIAAAKKAPSDENISNRWLSQLPPPPVAPPTPQAREEGRRPEDEE